MNPMEEIWNSVSKPGKDGKNYIFLKGVGDLAYLYLSGFVDVTKHEFKPWVEAFASSKLKDGSYAISYDQWLEKRPFRYEGPVPVPFNPNAIEEKEYTEEEFIKLLTETIIPNTQFTPNSAPQMMAGLRKRKISQNGKVLLNKKLKEEIINLMDQYPHPQRVLQTMVQALRQGKGARTALSQIEAQRSSFAAGMTAQQIAQARFSEIAKELKKEGISLPEAEVPAVSLKELKKKRKPPTSRA